MQAAESKQEISIEKLEEEESFKDDLAEIPPNDIVAYNELRSCADLLRMHESGQLDIQNWLLSSYVAG